MKNHVYVCVRETPDEGKDAVGVFDNEESAREWMRQEFVKFKEEEPHDKCTQDNENYTWGEGECFLDGLIRGVSGYKWWCYYELESYGWYVVKLPVMK